MYGHTYIERWKGNGKVKKCIKCEQILGRKAIQLVKSRLLQPEGSDLNQKDLAVGYTDRQTKGYFYLIMLSIGQNCIPYWSSVELNSTVLSAVPGPMSSSNGQDILQCCVLVFLKLFSSSGRF